VQHPILYLQYHLKTAPGEAKEKEKNVINAGEEKRRQYIIVTMVYLLHMAFLVQIDLEIDAI